MSTPSDGKTEIEDDSISPSGSVHGGHSNNNSDDTVDNKENLNPTLTDFLSPSWCRPCDLVLGAIENMSMVWIDEQVAVLLHPNQSKIGRCTIVPVAHVATKQVYNVQNVCGSINPITSAQQRIQRLIVTLSLLFEMEDCKVVQECQNRHLCFDFEPVYAENSAIVRFGKKFITWRGYPEKAIFLEPHEYSELAKEIRDMYRMIQQ